MTMKKHRGVALISVLLIVALVSILATKMTGKLIMQMQRVSNVVSNQQAYWYAIGAESFAKNVLKSSFDKDADITHLDQYWAQGETSYPVEEGEIVGQIFDLQSCFNLNALRTPHRPEEVNSPAQDQSKKPVAKESFERLLIALKIEDVDEFTAEYLADALVDWLDEDSLIGSAGGAEDSDYSGREFPYLAANHYIASIAELRTIEHFNADIINALRDYVCVIPNSDLHKININTITAENSVLLEALLNISAADASDLISQRDEDGFKKIEDFFSISSLADKQLTEKQKQQFAVDSEYFKLKTMASFNGSYVNLNSIFWVSKNNIQVIARSIGRE